MTLQTFELTIVGSSFDMAFDGIDYLIAVPVLEDGLSIRRNSTREMVVSKSLKAALGKEIPLGKKRVG